MTCQICKPGARFYRMSPPFLETVITASSINENKFVLWVYSHQSNLFRSKRWKHETTTGGMDSMPVNWEAFDALVIDFAKSENLIEDWTPSSSPASSPTPLSLSSYHSRLLIRHIRRSLESGEIDAALDLLRVHAPFVLEDHRLLFRLQKQVNSCIWRSR